MPSTHVSLHYHIIFSTKGRLESSQNHGVKNCTLTSAASSAISVELRGRSAGLEITSTFCWD